MQRQTTRNNKMHIEMLKVALLSCAMTATVLIRDSSGGGEFTFTRSSCLHFFPPRDIRKSPHLGNFAIQGKNALKCPCFSLEWGGWTVLELTDVLARGRGGGGYFRNFWVGMCRWDPRTLNPYQSYFILILSPYTRVNSPNPPILE